MTESQTKFVELEKRKIEYKEWLEELGKATQAVADEIGGVGKFFQDESDGTVFKFVKPTGRFVYYEDVSYVRTRRTNEQKGTLSIKEAKEVGFEV